jgi:hypothetical protein
MCAQGSPCSKERATLRGVHRALIRHKRYDVGATWAGWGSTHVDFSPWDGRSPVSHPTCDIPCPPRRTGIYRKGMISARPSCQ